MREAVTESLCAYGSSALLVGSIAAVTVLVLVGLWAVVTVEGARASESGIGMGVGLAAFALGGRHAFYADLVLSIGTEVVGRTPGLVHFGFWFPLGPPPLRRESEQSAGVRTPAWSPCPGCARAGGRPSRGLS
jgi:high-affinity nickel permease